MSREIVPFTDNYSDQSNMEGYQFEFFCERCGNGYRSPFKNNIKERGRGMLRAAGNMFGGRFNQLSSAAESMRWDRGTNSKEKDEALADAVEAVKPHFKQCRGCGNWACLDVCWNDEIGQCVNCSPIVEEEISRAQAAAQVDQIREKVKQKDWTEELDLTTRAKVQCPSCGAKVEGGKFCPECGDQLAVVRFCEECGAQMKEAVKFCAECGHKV